MANKVVTRAIIEADVKGQGKIKEFNSSLNKSKRAAVALGTSLGKVTGAVGLLAGAFGAYKVVGAIDDTIRLADEMERLTHTTGMSVGALDSFYAAGQKYDMTLSELETGTKALALAMERARNDTGEYARIMEHLGVDAYGSVDEAMYSLADAFSRAEDGSKKMALAQTLMSRSGVKMIPILNQGRDAIQEFTAGIDESAATMSDEFLNQLAELKTKGTELAMMVVKQLLPGMIAFLDNLNEQDVQAFKGSLTSLGEAILSTVEGFSSLVTVGQRIKAFMTMEISPSGWRAYKQELHDIELAHLNFESKLLDLRAKFARGSNASASNITGERAPIREFELPSLVLPDAASDDAGSGATEAAATKRTDYWRIELAHRAKLHDEYLADQAQRERDGYAAIMAAREQDKQDALASLAYRAEQHEEYLRQQEEAERAAFDAMMAERRAMLADLDSAVRGWGDTFTNTLVDGLLTGKMAWQDFANQIIRDLATMAVRAAITRPLLMSMGFGFADGGIMTSGGAVPLTKYARGGVARTPQMALYGEASKAEAYVPLPDGRSIPVSLQGAQGGASNVVTVNVNIAGDGKVESGKGEANGNKMASAIVAVVRKELLNQRRQGGLLAAG